jgi:hypothetical protein
MMSEHSSVNSKQQLTMFLELEFWDELGGHRKFPGRRIISISTDGIGFRSWQRTRLNETRRMGKVSIVPGGRMKLCANSNSCGVNRSRAQMRN